MCITLLIRYGSIYYHSGVVIVFTLVKVENVYHNTLSLSFEIQDKLYFSCNGCFILILQIHNVVHLWWN